MSELNWVTKHDRFGGNSSNSLTIASIPNTTITGLYSTNISISSNSLNLLVTRSGQTLAQLILKSIIGWSISSGTTLIIISDDLDPMTLVFIDTTELANAIIILENGVNL